MKISDLFNEVREFVDEKLAQGVAVRSQFLALEIMGKHPLVGGSDIQFYQLCALETLRAQCRKVLASFKVSSELPSDDDPLRILPGYERLQWGYMLVRDSESIVVPTNQITYDEFTEKADEYRKAAVGQRAHADELIRYRDDFTEEEEVG